METTATRRNYTTMMPTASSLLSLYASFSTTLMLLRNVYREIVPKKLETFMASKLSSYFNTKKPTSVTLIIDDSWDGLKHNQLIDAATLYLSTKIGPKNRSIRVGKFEHRKNATTALVEGEKVVDEFEGVEITWQFVRQRENEDGGDQRGNVPRKSGFGGHGSSNKNQFILTFEDKYRDKVMDKYLSHVMKTYDDLTREETVLKIYSRPQGGWKSIEFRHPSTFDTLAMDNDLKKQIRDDLDRFLARKEFYRRVGKPWRRGYLLYGPPGTGKSSLIAAMANYLNFNVYDLEFTSIHSDSDLRKALLDTKSKSIIVVEDIDCNIEAQDRAKVESKDPNHYRFMKRFSLSGLLNAIDGLWSSCGEERIIVFTTNDKEALDPALLRPGRMDMHIHMSYCTPQGFRVLASNYLEIHKHKLFEEIDVLIQSTEVTPASLAEELMKIEDLDIALEEIISFLKKKKAEKDQSEAEKKKEKDDQSEAEKEKKLTSNGNVTST